MYPYHLTRQSFHPNPLENYVTVTCYECGEEFEAWDWGPDDGRKISTAQACEDCEREAL